MDLDQIAQKIGENHTEVKSALDAQKTALAAHGARLLEVEQKVSRRGGGEAAAGGESWGAQVAGSEELKAYVAAGAKGRVRIDIKTTTTMTSGTTGTGAAGGLVAPDRQAPDLMPRRQLRVRDLLTPGRTTSNLVQVPRQTGRQLNATTITEGALKPQSDLAFELVDWPVRTIAHWVKASKQVLADAPVLQSTIDSELLYGLAEAEDNQLLTGDGTSSNLLGLIPQATVYDTSLTQGDDQTVDIIRRAMLQVRLALFPATGIVLNPTDWASMETLKDATGKYLFGDPKSGRPAAMWGLPVVDTEAISPGQFLVGAFGTAAQIFDREDAACYVSTEDSDNFVRNLVTVLAEERLALVVRRPAALIYGEFP